jgi:hypothetical protein
MESFSCCGRLSKFISFQYHQFRLDFRNPAPSSVYLTFMLMVLTIVTTTDFDYKVPANHYSTATVGVLPANHYSAPSPGVLPANHSQGVLPSNYYSAPIPGSLPASSTVHNTGVLPANHYSIAQTTGVLPANQNTNHYTASPKGILPANHDASTTQSQPPTQASQYTPSNQQVSSQASHPHQQSSGLLPVDHNSHQTTHASTYAQFGGQPLTFGQTSQVAQSASLLPSVQSPPNQLLVYIL